eukprot:221509-Chlamydomonas_euryale.AAC.3
MPAHLSARRYAGRARNAALPGVHTKSSRTHAVHWQERRAPPSPLPATPDSWRQNACRGSAPLLPPPPRPPPPPPSRTPRVLFPPSPRLGCAPRGATVSGARGSRRQLHAPTPTPTR